jgi:H2-forming N5,N10-methylenetetrahydromethanopterin dehydrogenase-like enzyme
MDKKSTELTLQTAELIQKQFGFENFIPASKPEVEWEELRNWLLIRIKEMLDFNFHALLQALYRIDVSEQRVKEILTLAPPETLHELLTDEILNRQLKKVITRNSYR